jgi:hypothetical protein
MKKKPYEKPSMEVFRLKQQSALLAGSGGMSGNDPFGNGGDPLGGGSGVRFDDETDWLLQ